MKATIGIRCENGVWADLSIINDAGSVLSIPDPGDFRPIAGWELSREAYQVAVLRSFHFLEMALRAKDGSLVKPAEIHTLAHHTVGLPLALTPGAGLLISVPLHEFYDLKHNVDYSLSLTYGDDSATVSAATQVRCS
jgi:hypothetical protein